MMPQSASNGLDAFFRPRGVAVIGASNSHDRPGARVLHNLPRFGYKGRIYPVTPNSRTLQGLPCYRSILDVPDPVDMAVVCVSAERTAGAIRECGRRGVSAAVVLANGFGGDTVEGQQLLHDLVAAHRESGMRIIGPNTVGIRMAPGDGDGMFATFAHDIEAGVTPGPIAVVAQSGGLGVYFGSAYMRRRGVGTRYVIDTGNELDVDSTEALEYVAQDPGVKCVGLILEGCRDGRRLAAAVRRTRSLGKPVVLLKVGRSPVAAKQMASHTGSLAGSADLFQLAIAEAGASIAHDEMEFVDALVIHAHDKAPKSRRMGVVSMSGGFAILALEAAMEAGLELPPPVVPPTPEQEPHLRSGTLANPFDYQSVGATVPQTIRRSLEWMLGQPNLDAVVIWQAFGLLAIEDRRKRLEADLVEIMPRFKTPLFGCGLTTPEYEARLRELGVLWFEEPTRLIKALSVVAPRATEPTPPPPKHPAAANRHRAIVGNAARKLLAGIEHVRTIEVHSAAEAQALAREYGRVVVKVESNRFPHKTEFGLIAGPLTPDEVPAAYEKLLTARTNLGATDEPVVLQPCERGVELALGAYIDPLFGPSIMVGTGGIFLEILRDTVFATAPVSEEYARSMILKLRGAPLLRGARGTAQCDIDAAARALAALSRFMAGANGAYESIDINPLMVRKEGKGAVAVDALLFARVGGEFAIKGRRGSEKDDDGASADCHRISPS
ncbi:MAG: acetate--CoA ligase family protein [Betaproteobacteria bacterium]|nr:acetate--CoA ligase family protein [Betaproteobacteria bacterium]